MPLLHTFIVYFQRYRSHHKVSTDPIFCFPSWWWKQRNMTQMVFSGRYLHRLGFIGLSFVYSYKNTQNDIWIGMVNHSRICEIVMYVFNDKYQKWPLLRRFDVALLFVETRGRLNINMSFINIVNHIIKTRRPSHPYDIGTLFILRRGPVVGQPITFAVIKFNWLIMIWNTCSLIITQ